MFRVTVTSRHTLVAHELRLEVVVNAMPFGGPIPKTERRKDGEEAPPHTAQH